MPKSFTSQQLALELQGKLQGDPACRIESAAPLDQARPGSVSFAEGMKQLDDLKITQASLVILSEALLPHCPTHALVVDKPRMAFAKMLRLLYPLPPATPGIHPSVILGKDTKIDPTAVIGPGVVLGDRVVVGPSCHLGAGCFIGDDSRLGEACRLYPRVTIYHEVKIGARAIIHSGAVIGADGFSFEPDELGQWYKNFQIGGVVVGDDVEIGANTTIDRGALVDTTIGNGVKLDNLVMIAHNVIIGDHSIIAGCTGIAGSVKIGRHCMIGGHSAINGHIELGDGVILTGTAMVTRSLLTPGVYSSGTGILPNKAWLKAAVRFRQLEQMYARLQQLERESP